MTTPSDTRPRFGIHTLQTAGWPELRDRWRWLEELGYDSLWLADHFFLSSGRDTPMYEAWTLLAGLALETRRARIGVLVSSNTFRHPTLLAKQAVTVDHVSDGRLELGIGAGWFVEEHAVFGLDLPETREQVDRFAEAVALIDRYLSNDESSFEGTYYRLAGAFNRPAPVQRPRPPLVIGAHRPRMLRVAARHADTWSSHGPVDELRQRSERLTEACLAIGRDPASVRRSVFYSPAQTPGEHPWDSIDAFEDYVGRHAEAGMQECILQLPGPDAFGVVERVAGELLPRLRRS